MGTGRNKPPSDQPHPRLVRLAKEVGAEIPLPPVAPKEKVEPTPQPRRAYQVTIIRRPGTAEEK